MTRLMMPFLLISLYIFIFQLLQTHLSRQKKEHYVTYFLPFYNKDANTLANFYKNKEYNYNSFKRKFNYDTLKVGINPADLSFLKILLNEYVSKSNIYTVQTGLYKTILDAITALKKNELNMVITSYTSLIYYVDELHNEVNNIRMVTKLYRMYIYVFTKKEHRIYSLDKIPYGAHIGIVGEERGFFTYYRKFFQDIGYTEGSDYTIHSYQNYTALFNALLKNECTLIALYDIYPCYYISEFIDNNASEEIILLPFQMNKRKEELFLKENPIIRADFVDLNELSDSYLPRKFGTHEYTKNRPICRMVYSHKILIANRKTDEKYIYSFIQFLYENIKYINKTVNEKGFALDRIGIDDSNVSYVNHHDGALRYFYDIGMITDIDNDNCKYLIGRLPCTKKNLANNNFL